MARPRDTELHYSRSTKKDEETTLCRLERVDLIDDLLRVFGVFDEREHVLRPAGDVVDVLVLETSGYVVHSLQTALHDGLVADSSEEAIVTAVNRGGDTDTIGAIAGAVAGAQFGASNLPDRWVSAVKEAEEIERLAERLVTVA